MLEWSDRGMGETEASLPFPVEPTFGQRRGGHLLIVNGPDGVGDLRGTATHLERAADAMQVRRVSAPWTAIPDFGGEYDAIWLTMNEKPADALLDRLDQVSTDGNVSLLFDVSGAAIDPVWSQFGDRDDVIILVDPDANEVHLSLGCALAARTMAIHGPVATDHERQIERLQEEVSRIARTLAKMSEPEARLLIRSPDGSREPPSPFIEDQVREARQGYTSGSQIRALGAAAQPAGPPIAASEVRRIIRLRRVRDQFFEPELFADPAWDMILDLYAARLEHNRVSVSSLCIAAAVPATTALRWIKALTTSGLFERRADPHDGRRIFVALSDSAAAAMHAYFAAILDEGAVI
jgi:hypothetical protein